MKIYPVVHITSGPPNPSNGIPTESGIARATDQARMALELGADGVFLIDHASGMSNRVNAVHDAVLEASSTDVFIGVNYLHCRTQREAFYDLEDAAEKRFIRTTPSGLWVDQAVQDLAEFDSLADLKAGLGLDAVTYFGGVAFKYTDTHTDDPDQAATEALRLAPYVDVVTTSGRGTGYPPPPDKIRAMKEAIGDKELAIASGVSAKNILDYPWADHILVSTSVETYPGSGEFVYDKLGQIIHMAHDL